MPVKCCWYFSDIISACAVKKKLQNYPKIRKYISDELFLERWKLVFNLPFMILRIYFTLIFNRYELSFFIKTIAMKFRVSQRKLSPFYARLIKQIDQIFGFSDINEKLGEIVLHGKES